MVNLEILEQTEDQELIWDYVVDFEDTKDWFFRGSEIKISESWIQESRHLEFSKKSINRSIDIKSILDEYSVKEPDELELEIALKEIDFSRKLIRFIENEPIEDGYLHAAEQLLENVLDEFGSIYPQWVESTYAKNLASRPTISASILRCIGRLPKDLVSTWGIRIADEALYKQNIEIREAAIRAFENWGDKESLEALKKYIATECVAWLANYANQVIEDFSELD